MMVGEFKSEYSSDFFILSLPADITVVIFRLLSPTDICNLSCCCKSLCDIANSENVWLDQCEIAQVIPLSEIVQWRTGVSSYKALCRFLVEVMKPLVGVWVHQEPELGNVVYVMPGFLSVVGCRIIPQKVGPLGIQEGRIMWSPVFEIICGFDGSTKFFLNGSDGKDSCLYPGLVTGIEKSCNVLSLEVEPRREKTNSEASRNVLFSKLSCTDKKNLVELVTNHVGLHVSEPLSVKLFPTAREDEGMLLDRRTMLLKMHKFGENWKHMNLEENGLCCYNPKHVDINEMWEKNHGAYFEYIATEEEREIRYLNRQAFSTSDTFGLSLNASYTADVCSRIRGWPNMNGENFSLYKLPVKNSMNDQEHAGLWGGTFGWPPGRCNEDATGNAFYLLMLSYQEFKKNNGKRLIGTKILEGTDYVNRPNGTPMFVVDIDSPSLEPFPFDADGIDFEHSYKGEGITDGYGFRCPDFKPGSLYVISDDHFAFVWHGTKDVFTLKRVNIEEILKKGLGMCVPPLPPTNNFTYMGRSYTNVFTEPWLCHSSSDSE
ncbi:unnamed protein product [Eruca vesicaria subsp. sativa]|uniref:F-box domain-containing protein n=1 Tax=Eruca vesicaria subsp. sativa TaxID=29727 RepID=A0ABC8KX82_ERUVS|nr:unnamed protein product [Eruca vesicaria subsp. sativa]